MADKEKKDGPVAELDELIKLGVDPRYIKPMSTYGTAEKKYFVEFPGVVDYAHKLGWVSEKMEFVFAERQIVPIGEKVNNQWVFAEKETLVVMFKCTVVLRDKNGNEKHFESFGSAHHGNIGSPNMYKSVYSLAETRAKKRCLADATNLNVEMEEFLDDNADFRGTPASKPASSSPNTSAPPSAEYKRLWALFNKQNDVATLEEAYKELDQKKVSAEEFEKLKKIYSARKNSFK